MTGVRTRSAGLTDTGLIRQANEDAMRLRDDVGVWLVADGMGGHQNGQWASAVIAEQVEAAALIGSFEADVDALGQAVLAANAVIYGESQARGAPMGSTVSLLHVNGGRFAVLWAGDSRAYLLRGGQLHRLSRDHTQVQEMVDRGLLTPEEAVDHPMGHVLSRAVGVRPALELEAVADAAAPRDVFLLCSDGLTGCVSDAEIADRLGSFSIDSACRRLLDLVLARGAPDNVTLIAVACEEATALVLQPTGG